MVLSLQLPLEAAYPKLIPSYIKCFLGYLFSYPLNNLSVFFQLDFDGCTLCGTSQVALVFKEPACQYMRHNRRRLDPWVGKMLWRRAWPPTPVFLLGESHGQKSLVGYGLWGYRRVRHNLATENDNKFLFC